MDDQLQMNPTGLMLEQIEMLTAYANSGEAISPAELCQLMFSRIQFHVTILLDSKLSS